MKHFANHLSHSLSIDYIMNLMDTFSSMDSDKDGYVTEEDLARSLKLPAVNIYLSSLFALLKPVSTFITACINMLTLLNIGIVVRESIHVGHFICIILSRDNLMCGSKYIKQCHRQQTILII